MKFRKSTKFLFIALPCIAIGILAFGQYEMIEAGVVNESLKTKNNIYLIGGLLILTVGVVYLVRFTIDFIMEMIRREI